METLLEVISYLPLFSTVISLSFAWVILIWWGYRRYLRLRLKATRVPADIPVLMLPLAVTNNCYEPFVHASSTLNFRR